MLLTFCVAGTVSVPSVTRQWPARRTVLTGMRLTCAGAISFVLLSIRCGSLCGGTSPPRMPPPKTMERFSYGRSQGPRVPGSQGPRLEPP